MRIVIGFVALVTLMDSVSSNFLNYLKPNNYHKGDNLHIHVGQLWSPRSAYPMDYYKLSWCDNSEGVGYDPDTIGVTMRDTKLIESPYKVSYRCAKNTFVNLRKGGHFYDPFCR